MAKTLSKKLQEEIHQRLIKEKEKLQRNIEELKDDDPFLDPDHVNDNAAIDTDVREQMGHDTIEAQVSSLVRRLNWVDAAIAKIYKKEYGFCENCGRKIDIDRLELIPEVRYCIDCEKKLVK